MTQLDASFPKKRISAGGLIGGCDGRLLIVKPSYREQWLLPGGVVEADESPEQALRREILEEIGVRVRPRRLLCIDYLSASTQYGESLHLLFECEPLTDAVAQAIRVDGIELLEFRWCEPEHAYALLVPSIAKRLRSLAPDASAPAYFENGEPPPA